MLIREAKKRVRSEDPDTADLKISSEMLARDSQICAAYLNT